MRIAILGGTGPEGRGLGIRLARAGESVILGSRSRERAESAVATLLEKVERVDLSGADNREAALDAEVVFISVPWEGLDPIFDSCGDALAKKLVVDLVVPMAMEDGLFRPVAVAEGSAGERIQARIPTARVVSAFKHQSAKELLAVDHAVEGDVLLCGDDDDARNVVAGLVEKIPDLRPVDCGALRNCVSLDAMTPLILNLNKRYKTRTSVKLLGL